MIDHAKLKRHGKKMKIEHAKGNSHADVMTGTGVHDYKQIVCQVDIMFGKVANNSG